MSLWSPDGILIRTKAVCVCVCVCVYPQWLQLFHWIRQLPWDWVGQAIVSSTYTISYLIIYSPFKFDFLSFFTVNHYEIEILKTLLFKRHNSFTCLVQFTLLGADKYIHRIFVFNLFTLAQFSENIFICN